MKPKEDPKNKAARLRERRMLKVEDQRAGQEAARGLTTDLRSIHGMSLFKSTTAASGLAFCYANPTPKK